MNQEKTNEPLIKTVVSGSTAEQIIAKLSHIFTEKSRNHIGKKIDEVP